MDVKARLASRAATALQRAVGICDARSVDQLGMNHATLVASIREASAEIADAAPQLDASRKAWMRGSTRR